jgi:hypothetical protein
MNIWKYITSLSHSLITKVTIPSEESVMIKTSNTSTVHITLFLVNLLLSVNDSYFENKLHYLRLKS